MTERLELYKCELCGNIVDVMHAGPGELVCCGQPMACLKENTVDAAVEKHVVAPLGHVAASGDEIGPEHAKLPIGAAILRPLENLSTTQENGISPY